jgi:hypothetical protein
MVGVTGSIPVAPTIGNTTGRIRALGGVTILSSIFNCVHDASARFPDGNGVAQHRVRKSEWCQGVHRGH